jgi:tetratricopeptide (TPR) repeat protein
MAAYPLFRLACRVIPAAIAAAWALGPMTAAAQQSPAGVGQSAGTAVDRGLSAELMYRLLVGDIALQRGDGNIAARAYLEAARDTRDPALARRATEIALSTRQRATALQAARLWAELEPGSERANQLVTSLASGTAGRAEMADDTAELRSRLERALAEAATSGASIGDAFLQLNRLLAPEPDRMQTWRLIRALAEPYPNLPEAHFAVALAAYNTGLNEISVAASAAASVNRALELKPGWERAVLLKAEILNKRSPAEAIAWLGDFLKANPGSRPATGALAQLYVEQKRYAEARALFDRLVTAEPTNEDFRFGAAVLAVQMKDWASAEAQFEALKRDGYGENGSVELYLAQIAEETGRYDVAIERYKAVPEGERGWLARLRIAAMMGKQGRVAEARRYLDDLPAVTVEQRVQVRQAEAQLLRDANDNAAAYAVLTRALAAQPDDPDLLYDAAMVAEKIDRVDEAIKGLTRLLELQPENAQAMNALGYTLVDRTPRVEEGFKLVERAHALSPQDPFILDSLGWAYFRLGKLDDAEKHLRQAMEIRPDPEIAAHLGEVLWAKGERERATEIWQSQLKATPDHPVLLETVRRLKP